MTNIDHTPKLTSLVPRLSGWQAVFRKEMLTAFSNPFTAIYLIIFDGLAMALMFGAGGFYDRNQADLASLFQFLPWLMMVFVPAWGMRMWAEERRQGTLELLFASPLTDAALIMGKYMAGLAVIGISLIGTMPAWLLITWLGHPDQGMIASGYLGVMILAAVMLAVTSAFSTRSDNQVSVLVLSILVILLLMITGANLVLDYLRPWLGQTALGLLSSLSLLTHFGLFTKGLIDGRSVVYGLALIIFGLYATSLGLKSLRR